MNWPLTNIDEIINYVDAFDPNEYAQTRNFKDGNISKLSPYISRGCISTKYIYDLLNHKHSTLVTEKFFQELLWRDYFQRLLQIQPQLYNTGIQHIQEEITVAGMPIAILNASTGINEIDLAINDLYNSGYMHNHSRLYVSSLCCNIAKSRFNIPAKWMYYHLLDADIASNFASWQWVAGNLTGKKYFTNQDNINFYSKSIQTNTFLDKPYEELVSMPLPFIFKDYTIPSLNTFLPETELPALKSDTTLIYNSYNLDPFWHRNKEYDRVLIFEPSHFERFPVSERSLDFICKIAENIPELIIYCGEFSELQKEYPEKKFIAKEHPILRYPGAIIDEREWIVPEIKGFFGSFSKYYTECLKYLNND